MILVLVAHFQSSVQSSVGQRSGLLQVGLLEMPQLVDQVNPLLLVAGTQELISKVVVQMEMVGPQMQLRLVLVVDSAVD